MNSMLVHMGSHGHSPAGPLSVVEGRTGAWDEVDHVAVHRGAGGQSPVGPLSLSRLADGRTYEHG